jgi:hypothetical protein
MEDLNLPYIPHEEMENIWPALRPGGSQQLRRQVATSGNEDQFAQVLAQLAVLTRQNARIQENSDRMEVQLEALRRENQALRQQLREAHGVAEAHTPYPGGRDAVAPPAALAAQAIPVAGDVTMMETATAGPEDTMDPDAKRLRTSAAPGRHVA